MRSDEFTIPNTINKLVQEYKAQGLSVWDIGNGECENFAIDLVKRLNIGMEHICDVAEFCINVNGYPMGFDWELLAKHWNINPSEEFKTKADKMIKEISPIHIWVAINGKHYDAEAPYGVENFFDLPFYKRYL